MVTKIIKLFLNVFVWPFIEPEIVFSTNNNVFVIKSFVLFKSYHQKLVTAAILPEQVQSTIQHTIVRRG